jgi:hypothetical protein
MLNALTARTAAEAQRVGPGPPALFGRGVRLGREIARQHPVDGALVAGELRARRRVAVPRREILHDGDAVAVIVLVARRVPDREHAHRRVVHEVGANTGDDGQLETVGGDEIGHDGTHG